MAIGLEIMWMIVLFIGFIFMVGDSAYTNTEAKNRIFDFIASWPAVAGFLMGMAALVRKWPGSNLEWICLVIGSLICALFTACFAYGLVN